MNIDIVPFASLEEALKEKKISLRTYERVKIAKSYVEKKYKMKRIEEEEKRKDWDFIFNKIEEMQLSQEDAERIRKEILHREGEQLRMKRKKIHIKDFESLSIIGKGAFGEVRVCRYKPTGEILAIKKMKKEEMHKKNQVLHVREEQLVLSEAKNPCIVDLKFSFQDDTYLYLVMEFLPGGDLMSLLMTKDILTEEETRFYAAELVLAIESVHKLNCIHRDLKPDNVLIDKNGHIKLSDFGLSKKLGINLYENENLNGNGENNSTVNMLKNYSMKDLASMSKSRKRRIYAFSTVGTPDYIAPEVFCQKGYGPEVDWWSLGVILFEMLIGYPPFFSDSATETCKKILNWKNNLSIPPETKISKEAVDLIRRLITDVDKRLGYNGAEEIKKHPFFKGVVWDKLSQVIPCFVPEIDNEWDTKYFDHFDEDEPFYPPENAIKKQSKDICFVNFTYKREMENYKSNMVSALEVLDSLKESLKNTDKNINHMNEEVKPENGGPGYRMDIKKSIIINNYPEKDQELDNKNKIQSNEQVHNVNPFNNSNYKNHFLNEKNTDNISSNVNEFLKPTSSSQNSNSQFTCNSPLPLIKTNLNIEENICNNYAEQSAINNYKSNSNGHGLKDDYSSNNNMNMNNLNSPTSMKDMNNCNIVYDTNKIINSNSNTSKDFIKQVSKIKKPVPTNASAQLFSNVSKVNQNGNVQMNNNLNNNGNNYESRLGGSDYLLKSNNEVERKNKSSKSKAENSNPKSPVDKKDKIKKINPIQIGEVMKVTSSIAVDNPLSSNEYSNANRISNKKSPSIKIEIGDQSSHDDYKRASVNSNKVAKKVPDKISRINYNYASNEKSTNNNLVFNNQPNSLISTNYLRDFTSEMGVGSFNSKIIKDSKEPPNKNLISSIKIPNSQLKASANKEITLNLNKINNDSSKPLSTKNSTANKIVFSGNNNNNNLIPNCYTGAVPNNQPQFSTNPKSFLKIKDTPTIQSQRANEKIKKK